MMPHKLTAHFANQADVASYVKRTQNIVPGLADLHRMVMLLLAEQAPNAAHILVVGAGGGMETKAMAEAQPDWRFTGVDPSPAMLDLAREILEPVSTRIELVEGTIDHAPAGPFDGATCLLMMHHLDEGEKVQTLQGVRRRLKPGARLVVVEHSAPAPNPVAWMTLAVAFADRAGPDWGRAASQASMMTQRLSLLSPVAAEGLLQEAGFQDISLFYAAFSFRGWVATAPDDRQA